MSERYFSGLGKSSSTDQGNIRNRMMRRPEWPLCHQGSMIIYLACYRMDLGCLKRFFKGKWRYNRRYSFGKHGFPGSRRANHYQIMPACCSHLKCPFDIFLAPTSEKSTSYLFASQAKISNRSTFTGVNFLCAIEKFNHLSKLFHSIYFQTFHHSRFPCILNRHNQSL